MTAKVKVVCLQCKRQVREYSVNQNRAFCEHCYADIFLSEAPKRTLSPRAVEIEKQMEREQIFLNMIRKMLRKLE